jgi:hypothetical protein
MATINVSSPAAGPGSDVNDAEAAIRGRIWVRVVSRRADQSVELGLRGRDALIWATEASMAMSLSGWGCEVFERRPDGQEIRAFRSAPGDE